MKRQRQLSPHQDLKKGGPRRRGFVITDARGEQTVLQYVSPGVVLGDGTIGSVPSSAVTSHWQPLTDGAEPPTFITDGLGNLIYVWVDL